MGSKRRSNGFVVPGSRCTGLLHVFELGVVLERCGDEGGAHRVRQVVVRGCDPVRSSGRCFGIADRIARALSGDCSPSGLGSRVANCCVRHRKIDKLTAYALADRGIRNGAAEANLQVGSRRTRLKVGNPQPNSMALNGNVGYRLLPPVRSVLRRKQ